MSQFFEPPEGAVVLTPKQANIYLWGWQTTARFRDAVCGRRFGKTFLAKAEMRRAARLAAQWNVSVEDEIWYAAPTFKQAKRVFWKRLKQAIPASWRAGKPNETECTITLKSGHVIRVVGLDNYDDLRGSGLFFLIIDEWADCKWAAWEEVLRPMLSTCKYIVNGIQRVGGHVLRIGTPKGFNHCYDTFMDGQPGHEPDCRSFSYTSLQGGNIPESEIIVAKRKMDPKTFSQEYEASFESYQGVIYYCFNRILNSSDETVHKGDTLHIGMDFNVTKMAAVVYVRRGDTMHAVDEFVNLFDTPAMIEAIKERYPDYEVGIYPDASGDNRKSNNASETDIAMLKKAGFKVYVNASMVRAHLKFQLSLSVNHLVVMVVVLKSSGSVRPTFYNLRASHGRATLTQILLRPLHSMRALQIGSVYSIVNRFHLLPLSLVQQHLNKHGGFGRLCFGE